VLAGWNPPPRGWGGVRLQKGPGGEGFKGSKAQVKGGGAPGGAPPVAGAVLEHLLHDVGRELVLCQLYTVRPQLKGGEGGGGTGDAPEEPDRRGTKPLIMTK